MKTVYFKKAAIICSSLCIGLIFIAFTYPAKFVKHTSLSSKAKAGAVKRTLIKADLKDMSLKNIQFGFDKDAIQQSALTELNRVAKLMIDNNASIQLSGHADNKGPYVYNWNLSKQRAEAVKAYLVKMGANGDKIAAAEFGDTKPIASNHTKQGRQKNRRVEMAFL